MAEVAPNLIKKIVVPFLLVAYSLQFCFADSLWKRTVNGVPFYNYLRDKGFNETVLMRAFDRWDQLGKEIKNMDRLVVVDFGYSSTLPRLFLINIRNGRIEKFLVSHGINSGILVPTKFSNVDGTWQSSLGAYITGKRFQGSKNGLSLQLFGMDPSNSNALNRDIFVHGAEYVSQWFISENGRLGWSKGCFAVSADMIDYIVDMTEFGTYWFTYNIRLMEAVVSTPLSQTLPPEPDYGGAINTEPTEIEKYVNFMKDTGGINLDFEINLVR